MSQRSASQRDKSQRSFSQRHLSQGCVENVSQKSRSGDLTEEQFESAVLKVTNFLLCDLRCKRKIRKEDVVTNVLKSARQYAAIMKRVDINLSKTFGLQIMKLPDNDDAFIIVNKHKDKFIELTQELTTIEVLRDDSILTVVLSTIFMNRGQMYQSHVMAVLETIGFLNNKFYDSFDSQKTKDHVFKLVTKEFVNELYLQAVTVPRPDQVQVPALPEGEKKVTVLQWGFRAYLEADVDKIVDYLVKMFDGNKPPGFPSAYYMELKAKQKELQAGMMRRN